LDPANRPTNQTDQANRATNQPPRRLSAALWQRPPDATPPTRTAAPSVGRLRPQERQTNPKPKPKPKPS